MRRFDINNQSLIAATLVNDKNVASNNLTPLVKTIFACNLISGQAMLKTGVG